MLAYVSIYADTTWNGGNQSGSVSISSGDSFNISGVNYLVAPITITNSSITTASVNITADALISSGLQLYFYTSAGSTTEVNVSNDLVFTGSNGLNLLITASGSGTLNFNISSGQTLSFTSTTTLSGGAIFLADMTSGTPIINFQSADTTLTANATVDVGLNSAISFLGNAPGQTGTINFDASVEPASIGRFILQINNGGSVVNDVAQLTGQPVTLQNIAFNAGAAYGTPTINFVADNVPDGFAGTLIVNGNTTWAGLTSNPFCELSPTSTTAIKKGFVLGAGSVLKHHQG